MTGWTEVTLAAALLAGLTGSVHCAAMCAPLLGIACGAHGHASARSRRLACAAGYHCGRIASYSAAGALVGALGAAGLALRPGAMAQQALLVAMSAALLLFAAYVAGWGWPVRVLERSGSVIWRRIEPYSRAFLPADTPGRAFALGLAWGWLPCGLVYAALLAALAAADPLHGAMLMAAFGLGTLPSLLAASAGIAFAVRAGKSRVLRTAVASIIAAAAVYGIVHATQPSFIDPAFCTVPGVIELLGRWF